MISDKERNLFLNKIRELFQQEANYKVDQDVLVAEHNLTHHPEELDTPERLEQILSEQRERVEEARKENELKSLALEFCGKDVSLEETFETAVKRGIIPENGNLRELITMLSSLEAKQ